MKSVFELIRSDWHRYTALHKRTSALLFIGIFFHNPGMIFSFLFRVVHYLITHKNTFVRIIGNILWPVYYVYSYYVLDIDIPPHQVIGKGLYVHNRGITFGADTSGSNLTLIGPLTVGPKGTMIGGSDRPCLGNSVTIFAGARVLGDIRIGNNVSIGANAVVIKNVPSRCVVGGVPAKIIRRLS